MKIIKEVHHENKIIQKNQKLLFFSDRLISLFGTNVYNFMLSLLVLKTSNSVIPFVITLLVATIPKIIFNTIAGIIIDKFDRKKILILSDFINFIILIILYFSIKLFGINIYFIYICTILINSISVFFETTMTASITSIFNSNEISNILSMQEIISSTTNIICPIIGGFLFGIIEFKFFIFVNAISFLLSSFISKRLIFKYNSNIIKDKHKEISFRRSINEINHFIFGNKIILTLYSAAIFINIFFTIGVTIVTPYVVNNILELSTYQYGIINSTLMSGMVISSIIISKVKEPSKKYKFIILGFFIEAISIILISFPNFILLSNTNYFVIYNLIFLFLGMAVAIVNIYVRTIMQKIVPEDKKGRVFGTLGTFCTCIVPISMIISALYIEKYNPFILSLGSGILFLTLTIIIIFSKNLKNI